MENKEEKYLEKEYLRLLERNYRLSKTLNILLVLVVGLLIALLFMK